MEKVVMEKDVRDSILLANCDLMAENQRLKAQLDKEIHINRIMLNTINFYANKNFWYDRDDESGWEVAQQTLKQIEEME